MSLSLRNRRKVTCLHIYFFRNIPTGKVRAEEGKPCQLQCRGQANVHLVKCYHKDSDCQVSIFSIIAKTLFRSKAALHRNIK